jgi:hypothetical protein
MTARGRGAAVPSRHAERSVRAPRQLRDLVRRVHRTRRTRARIIIEQSIELLPHYRGVSGARLAAVRRSVLHHLGLFYNVTLATGRALTAEDLEPSRQVARRRAAEGVPLGEFLTFFQIGLTVIWEHLMATAGGTPALRDLLLDRVDAIISNQTQLMTALVEAYVEERERLSRFRERDLDEFFSLLLADEAPDPVLEARARSLGLALDESHAVAVFGPGAGEPDGDFRSRLGQRLPAPTLRLGRTRDGFVAALPDGAQLAQSVEEAASAVGARAGVGTSGRGLASLRRSAHEALRALRIGAALGGAPRAHRYDDVAVLDLVRAGSPDSDAFVRRTLGPLLDGASRSPLETLRQLGAHGHRIKPAAAALGIHPHTLTYRLKQLRRRFALDLDDPEVRLRVQLALRILDAGAAGEPRRPRRRPRSR